MIPRGLLRGWPYYMDKWQCLTGKGQMTSHPQCIDIDSTHKTLVVGDKYDIHMYSWM